MELRTNSANIGLNLNSVPLQIEPGQLSYALNAVVQGFDGKRVSYQNEAANELCLSFVPSGYEVIGRHSILETDETVLFLAHSNGGSEIGIMKDCLYRTVINDGCLNFSINHPIKKAIHKKREIYFTDGNNQMRYIDLDNPPYKEKYDETRCENILTEEVDCNKLNVQPNFLIPTLETTEVEGDGELLAGTYQFGIQYSDSASNAYTGVYSITNPLSIHDPNKITQDFNYPVSKSVSIEISNVDNTGIFDFVNLIVIKTNNNISSYELIGTYDIKGGNQKIVYTGQKIKDLSADDIFERFPAYSTAQDVFSVQNVLGWAVLKEKQRRSYQKIFSKIIPQWQTWRIDGKKGYKDPINTANRKSWMRDEVYPIEGVFEFKDGTFSDRFLFGARKAKPSDLIEVANSDGDGIEKACDPAAKSRRYWQVYNTATKIGRNNTAPIDDCYEGPYEYGEFAYHESTELYPCDEEVWGDLAGKPILLPRFPDHLISSHFDNNGFIYPIGVRIDIQDLVDAINLSDLSAEEKDRIAGIKIVRGNRANNKRVKAKGIINNVLKYRANDRIINSASVSGGSTDAASATIDSMQNLIQLSKKRFKFFGAGRRDRLDFIERKIEDLRTMTIGTPEYKHHLEFLITEVDTMIDKSKDDRADEYLGAVRQILESLIDASDSVADSLEDIEDLPSENDSLTQGLFYFPNYLYNDVRPKDPFLEDIVYDESAKSRFTMHSPDLAFYKPTLGNTLKLELGLQGRSVGHIVETKRHAKYQFVNSNAYITSLLSGMAIGFASGQYGVSTRPFDGTAAFTAYRAMVDIIHKVTPRRNPAHQYNSVGRYTIGVPIPNNGNKIRNLDIAIYLAPGKFAVGDDLEVNNYQRESSVYLKTGEALPFVHENVSVGSDKSKLLFPDYNLHESTISTYYASVIQNNPGQWGQVFSYEYVDTGFRMPLDLSRDDYGYETIFGGDIYISPFSYKSKLPFFIDHRVNPESSNIYPDESDVFYNELSNVGRVKYWFSTDATKGNGIFNSIFGIRPHRFFWQKYRFFDNYGMIFLFAYGIPTFWVESEVNVEMRQAYNEREGDFYPRVSSSIPDDWLQQSAVSIEHDNSYNYNKTYSKQNKETFYSFLPLDYENRKKEQETLNLYRAVYSDPEDNQPRNNWLIYRPVSYHNFPQNHGKLISVEGIEDRAFLARFENKSLLYGATVTMDVRNAKAVYLGNDQLFGTPPLSFAESDLGYNGTQNVFFSRTPFGHVSIDAKRGKIFLISGNNATDLSSEELNVSTFFERELPFKILKYFPTFDIDNNYKGIGLHGTFNGKRLIITKLDYEPLYSNIIYTDGNFVQNGTIVSLDDTALFCNKSFTISFDFTTGRWISFHSYAPNYYIGGINKFYSGQDKTLWIHDKSITKYNSFYGKREPYILEYPFAFQSNDEILQTVRDYTKVTKHINDVSFTVANHIYFNKAIIYNDEQCSGWLYLHPKPTGNLAEYRKYPIYQSDGKRILFTKSDNIYSYNTFWDVVKDNSQPIFIEDCGVIDKALNQNNMDYTRRFKKALLRGKDLKIRHILDDTDEYRLVSQFMIIEDQISFK